MERVVRLENHDAQAEEAAVMEGQNTALREARFNALYSLAQELAAHEGISEEQFLKIAEDINPNWAGQIDERDQDEMPESESYPPLFET